MTTPALPDNEPERNWKLTVQVTLRARTSGEVYAKGADLLRQCAELRDSHAVALVDEHGDTDQVLPLGSDSGVTDLLVRAEPV